jgi:hypothetical protein
MSRLIFSLFRKLAGRRESAASPPTEPVEFSIEELEARRLPAADVTLLLAALGTPSSTGSTNTADPVVVGYVGGDPIVGIEFEFDRNSDGSVDGNGFLEQGLGDFTYDLREIDSTLDDFEGTMTVRARAIELDGQGAPVAAGQWASTEFFLFGPPPTLSGFTASEGADDTWTFSGSAGGAHAAGATIEFGGILAGQTVQADSSGNFSLSVTLGEIDGTATAKVIDSFGQESETAEFYCCSVPDPVFTDFSGSEGENDTWTFAGTVSGPTAAGATITFGGILAGQTVQVDSCGHFSATFQLGNVDGTVTAQASDGDGRVSDEVESYCVSQPDPPEPWQIGSFSGAEVSDDYWIFSGTIDGCGSEGATVTFGGVLAGYTAQVDANGAFSLSLYLGNIDGYATAEVLDPTNELRQAEVYCVSQPDPPETWQFSSFSGTEGADDCWTFSGTIDGNGTEGATITFGGVLTGYTAQVGANGAFSLSASLGNIDGYASAQVVDPSGQTREAEAYCCSEPDPEPLVISSFIGTLEPQSDGLWCFVGTVTGAHSAWANISFGGVLEGASVQADANGSFVFSVQNAGLSGAATAIAANAGAQSGLVEIFLQS